LIYDQELAIKTATEMLYPTAGRSAGDSADLLVEVIADFPSTVVLEGGIAQVSSPFGLKAEPDLT